MKDFIVNINSEKIVWVAAFALGLILFIWGLVSFIRKKNRREIDYAVAALWEYLACVALYVPGVVYNELSCPDVKIRWIEGIWTALLRCINACSSGAYDKVAFANYEVFSSIYSIIRISANICSLLFFGGFILKYLIGPLQRLKLSFSRKKCWYVFSACNEKNIAIANSIYKDGKASKKVIVFANADDIDVTLKSRVQGLGGICVNCSVYDLILKYSTRASSFDLYIFGENDEKNISQLSLACNAFEKIHVNNAKVMVELVNTPWDLYDDYIENHNLQGKGVVVNFVRIEETFIYNDLLDNSIFDNAISDGEHKIINALIAGGINSRNVEMLKALLHLSQMPGYFLNLTVIDNMHGRTQLNQMIPELYDDGAGIGDAIYHLSYIEGVDYDSAEFEKTISDIAKDLTFVFVNAGDDLINIKLALLIKAAAARKGNNPGEYTLQVSLMTKEMYEQWNSNICSGLMPVGSIDEIYNYKYITNSRIEEYSRLIHFAGMKDESERETYLDEWNGYLNNEYYRHSVFARTLSFKYKFKILGDNYRLLGIERPFRTRKELEDIWNTMSKEEKMWKTYEHMRWNMYTRTLGYRKDENGLLKEYKDKDDKLFYEMLEIDNRIKDSEENGAEQLKLKNRREKLEKEKQQNTKKIKEIRTIAHIHEDLVNYEKVPLSEKVKDVLVVTDEVVEFISKN